MIDRDYAEGVDALQSDMARHQREIAGGEVTAAKNHAFAVATIERLEREQADAPPPAPPGHTPAPAPTLDKKTIEDRTYTLDAAPSVAPMFRTASEFEHQVMRHAMPRIELLMSKQDTGALGTPSWRTRTLAAMYFKAKAVEAGKAGRTDLAEIYERAFQLDVAELLEASNISFGDWRKDAPTKIVVGV